MSDVLRVSTSAEFLFHITSGIEGAYERKSPLIQGYLVHSEAWKLSCLFPAVHAQHLEEGCTLEGMLTTEQVAPKLEPQMVRECKRS